MMQDPSPSRVRADALRCIALAQRGQTCLEASAGRTNPRAQDACPRSHERGAVPTVLHRVHCRAIARLQRDRRQRKCTELRHSRHARSSFM